MSMTRKISLIFLTVFFTLPVFGAFAQSGVIKELSGTVELKPNGANDFSAAKAGDRVNQDTVISTGFKSTALVEVGSAIITVKPLTRLTLKEISASQGEENVNMNLRAGRVRVELTPPAGTKTSMSVTSPVATASVRGTIFDLDTQNLYVERGSVAFRGERGGAMLINAGYWSYLDRDNRAVDPIGAKLTPRPPVGTAITGSGNYNIAEPSVTLIITPDY
jgi:hypothetical protein